MSSLFMATLGRVSLGACVIACAFGCKSTPKGEATKADTNVAATPAPVSQSTKAGVKTFGAALQPSEVAPLAEVLTHPDQFKDKTVTVAGHVRRACSKKGCWMELAQSAEPSTPACRVSFKDYGFFVPIDSAGSEAKVQGHIALATIKATHVDHLEKEGATFAAKSPDGTAQEVRLVADGVELWR